MLIVGLQGSPRKRGNTSFILSRFLDEAAKYGAESIRCDISSKEISPCREINLCEKKGYCPIEDDMSRSVYRLIREADVVILASPIFFYNVTAQMKALIDRCQVFWARKYRLHLKDPGSYHRRGFIISVAATSGQSLFDGVHLTARYFFDAISAQHAGSLTYRKIEHPEDFESLPGLSKDIEDSVKNLLEPLAERKHVLFASRRGHCRTQMACAFLQILTKGKTAAHACGLFPEETIDGEMISVMEEKGIDMAFRRPFSLTDLGQPSAFDRIVCMDEGIEDKFSGLSPSISSWQIESPSGKGHYAMQMARDLIEKKIHVEFQ